MDHGWFQQNSDKYIKENVLRRPPLSVWWLCLAVAATLAALGGVALIDYALPVPLTRETAPPDQFIAEIAYEHLVNLTSMGPRVAGSYENEVLAVSLLAEAVRLIARGASPHNRVDIDLHTASGAFNLTFLDGMNNVYRGVRSVVARVSAAGGRARPANARTALLLNCHFDTVPDSPGASDDGAGCAVALETLRAVAASPRPLRHDAVFLFNGAEENIMQASHGFITQHKWAKSVRAFINIEACGAGGREVLFQAGPHDPWIMEVYAGAVPHPFASSLAQEIFESGLIPADTDFRIFRDFGKLSGVDLAWSANGYVYHTALDTAQRVPRAALQRTGDNVLALLHGLLSSASLESEADSSSRQPVFFDVVGVAVVALRAPAAAGAALVALATVALKVHLTAAHASKHLYVSRGSWWRVWWRTCWWVVAAHACGVAASVTVGVVLHAAGARLTFYTHVWLLAPLYAVPAVLVSWWVCAWGASRSRLARGWWAWRACGDATCSAWAALLLVCLVLRLRSGFLPLLWTLPAAADVLATITRATEVGRSWWWCAGSVVPLLQTWYLALGSLNMFVPIMGRAGAAPADPMMSALVSSLTLAACGWMLPFVVAARGRRRLIYVCAACCAATVVLAACTPLGAPYSPLTPQRFMVFHVRRAVRDLRPAAPHAPPAAHLYWVPRLDGNTPHSVDMYVSEMSSAQRTSAEECARWVYCGAPYYLPVLSLVPQGHWLRATHAPLATAHVDAATAQINRTAHQLKLDITGPSHIVVIVSPVEGAYVSWYQAEGSGAALQEAPLEGPRWGARRTYFIALYDPYAPAKWSLTLVLQHSYSTPPAEWAQVSVSGHVLSGADKLHPAHTKLLERFPAWTATTGWGVDMHLITV